MSVVTSAVASPADASPADAGPGLLERAIIANVWPLAVAIDGHFLEAGGKTTQVVSSLQAQLHRALACSRSPDAAAAALNSAKELLGEIVRVAIDGWLRRSQSEPD